MDDTGSVQSNPLLRRDESGDGRRIEQQSRESYIRGRSRQATPKIMEALFEATEKLLRGELDGR